MNLEKPKIIGLGLRIVYSENVLFQETSSAISLDRRPENRHP
jgi:hypothetical protein